MRVIEREDARETILAIPICGTFDREAGLDRNFALISALLQ